ncbi:MAG: DegT/DnrJ/EryC1/StrS family aminotransferase, partial [Planctomycetota bacterium]
MQVKLLDLTRQWKTMKADVERVVHEVFEDSLFILGKRVADFEAVVSDYCGVAGAVGVASGTDALLLSLRACGIEHGEEVLTTPYTFFATAGAIWNAGGKPAFVDIDPATFNLDAEKIEEAITERTKVIMPVHLFGQPADMDPILQVAEKRGLKVIEDGAQAIGAEYQGKRVGQLGDLCAFSFFPTKNLGGAGDGGMVV